MHKSSTDHNPKPTQKQQTKRHQPLVTTFVCVLVTFVLWSLLLEAQLLAFPNPAHKTAPPSLGWVFVVTPTYTNPNQIPHLLRVRYALLGQSNLHWVVVEDAFVKSELVSQFLERSGIKHTHLAGRHHNITEHRGVHQRNFAIAHISELVPKLGHGVIYFADDDNTYDTKLFDEVRSTTTIKVWPVGLISFLQFEGPVCTNNSVSGWRYAWGGPQRRYPVDMAGFAVSTKFLFASGARFDQDSDRGFMETDFISKLVPSKSHLEIPRSQCHAILSWHTQSETQTFQKERFVEAEPPYEVRGAFPNLSADQYKSITGSSNKAQGRPPDRKTKRKQQPSQQN